MGKLMIAGNKFMKVCTD